MLIKFFFFFFARDLKMLGSHSDLHFTGTVIDLPDGSGKSIAGDLSQLQQLYPATQQKTAQYHSLPRVQSMDGGGGSGHHHHSHQPNQQQHLWSSTTGEHHLSSDHQLARWLDSHGLVWSAAPAAADSGGHFSRGGVPAAAVRVLDIIDTNNGGLSSGQIDAYGLMEANSSTAAAAAAAAAFTAADFSTLLDDDGAGGGLHFDGSGLEPVAFIPLDI